MISLSSSHLKHGLAGWCRGLGPLGVNVAEFTGVRGVRGRLGVVRGHVWMVYNGESYTKIWMMTGFSHGVYMLLHHKIRKSCQKLPEAWTDSSLLIAKLGHFSRFPDEPIDHLETAWTQLPWNHVPNHVPCRSGQDMNLTKKELEQVHVIVTVPEKWVSDSADGGTVEVA